MSPSRLLRIRGIGLFSGRFWKNQYLIKVFLERILCYSPVVYTLSIFIVCSAIYDVFMLIFFFFLSFSFCWLSFLSVTLYYLSAIFHLTTKILTINISVIACSLGKKKFDETHLSKLSCGTCLHMQVTAEFVKNCCFWQFRSCRRKEVVSPQPVTSCQSLYLSA